MAVQGEWGWYFRRFAGGVPERLPEGLPGEGQNLTMARTPKAGELSKQFKLRT